MKKTGAKKKLRFIFTQVWTKREKIVMVKIMSDTAQANETVHPVKLIGSVMDIETLQTALVRAWAGLDACRMAEVGCSKRRSFKESSQAQEDVIRLLQGK